MRGLVWETAEELDLKLAQRVRNIRRRRSISQKKLADMSGVSYGSIKRFETTGQISLVSLTKNSYGIGYCGRSAECVYTDSVSRYSGGYQ